MGGPRHTFGNVGVVLLLLFSQCPPAFTADLISSNYQFGDLRLNYLPPANDGGEPISKYKIEWDTSGTVADSNNGNIALEPSFSSSSQNYGFAEVTNVREEQEIIVSCRSACLGTFQLSWGGRITDPLRVDATSERVETAIQHLLDPFNPNGDTFPLVRVSRKANGFAYKWKVVFLGIHGDIGLIKADGDRLVGGGASVRVEEVTSGSSDLYPGAYTHEIQTVSVRKRNGFGCEAISGSFEVSFEGRATAQIDVDASAEDFKDALESLSTIHTVHVRTDHHESVGIAGCASRSWIVTFTHLVHENRQGAGDIGLLQLGSSSFDEPTVTQLSVFENIKGTNPRSFTLRGLHTGMMYYCRVSAYNSLGYGLSSLTVSATPKDQPSRPGKVILGLPDPATDSVNAGTSLLVSWDADNEYGSDAITDYSVEWYSEVNDVEVQKLTTSASDGITEVQSIKISAEAEGITGYFTLTFNEEATELIAHDADADGDESIEMKLERLSTVGDVEVSREYSWKSITDVEFDFASSSDVLSRTGGSYAGNLVGIFAAGEMINVGGEVHTISSVGSTFLMLNTPYSGPSAVSVHILKWSFGYEWLVTFNSHVGPQPLLQASPSNNWAGTNPIIGISRVREGLQPLSGTIRMGFEGERTLPIPYDADASLMKQALESLTTIGEVDVARFDNNNGHNYFVTFLSELGDREQLTVDDLQLTGPDARASVATLVEGTDPSNYGSVLIPRNSQLMKYQIKSLNNGVSYFVRVRGRNSNGYGYAAFGSPSPMTPVRAPTLPTSVSMFPLSGSRIRMAWQAPASNGGSRITKYSVQWDTDESFPSAWSPGFFQEVFVGIDDDSGTVYCHTFTLPPSPSSMLRYGRVLAYNGYKWSDIKGLEPLRASAVVGHPGPVREFDAFPTSSIGIMLTWSHPAIDDAESCGYAGDGGADITHYVIEYDEEEDFSSPATSVTVPSTITEFRIGGRDVLSGSESPVLKAGGKYYARIIAFNSVGPGIIETFSSAVGPLADTSPSAPDVTSASAVSATSVRINWNAPAFDGGSAIQEYIVEYDTDANFDKAPRNTTVPTVSEVRALQVGTDEMALNVQVIQATVAVTNEVQSIKTEVAGVDEIQQVSTTCDDVTAEVQMIVTTAVDTNEEQMITLVADDVDEIQLVRTEGDNKAEIQSVQVSVQRVNEVQKLGIVISNINTAGDGVQSTACMGLNVGDACQEIEDALAGSFTVSFDFDQCGADINDGVNYCQLALSKYDADLGSVVCSPGLVNNPFSGGDHCVSEPVVHSFASIEGNVGTLQYVLNNLIDNNGKSFMTSLNVPGKQEAVSVIREGRIKTKGSCTLDPLGIGHATCTGEYEISYEISFDAIHSSGDVPPVTVITSDFRLDSTSPSFVNSVCPVGYYVHGCENPVGAALDAYHGSFYNGEISSVAIEAIKGSQPRGKISLVYECESLVTKLPDTYTMAVSSDGMSASFDNVGFVGSISVGQFIRFNAGNGLDHYRKIVDVDSVNDVVVFASQAPSTGAFYTDVEYGDYFSDWNESDGVSGVSSHCQGSRIHTTLLIDVDVDNAANSVTDWRGKMGALSVIDSSGITVSRSIVSDLMTEVGLVWEITFNKQPGNVHEMVCNTVSGTSDCTVSTLQDASIIGGHFKLQTLWPHEYVAESPQLYETGIIRWNCDAAILKRELESITDVNNNKVFGSVHVTRNPYSSPSQSRWSGAYLWTITFQSRGGNVPALTFDSSYLVGVNPRLAVSDEDSGDNDLFQGVKNSASFIDNDPGLARDGNQLAGSFALSWPGNTYHDAVVTSDVFSIQTGGSLGNRFTALSADAFKALFEEYVLLGAVDQVDVVRSEQPTQWMGYSYSVKFRHEDVGGDVPILTYMQGSTLGGRNAYARIDEAVKGTQLIGSFQLRFEGETTRPINYDATAQDLEEALNELNTIAPSAVTVSGGDNPIRSGPSDGSGGMSTQVGGRIWYVTFASNVWKDPTAVHDPSFVPGNWVGPPASSSDTWSNGFSKAWGKNVGNIPMIICLKSGLLTTNGALPDDGCSISEVVAGTDPLGGAFKICLDSASTPNGVMSVETGSCTEFIPHNAVASAAESGGNGSSMEEKLEKLANVGDVQVTRSAVNTRNGGYTWTIQFEHDVDGPCEQKDDLVSLCNAPGDVPKLCDPSGSTPCDTSSLQGACLRPGLCQKLSVLDATDYQNGNRFPGGNEKQVVFVRDAQYLGWKDGSVVDVATIKEYKLIINGVATECINHNALSGEMATAVQNALDSGIGGSVRVDRTRSEDLSKNGFVYYLTFYDTADLDLIDASFHDGACSNDFEPSQSVEVLPLVDGSLHSANCEDCIDGIVQRGDITMFEVPGDGPLNGILSWNAEPNQIKAHLEQSFGRTVEVTRTVLNKYGTMEWLVTFTENVGTTPPGAGDIPSIVVAQDDDTSGQNANIQVNEIVKGSDGLSGTFTLNYQSSRPRSFAFDESPERMLRKLEEMNTIGRVFVTRDCYPSCSSGGWGGNAVSPGSIGGYQWKIHFLKNPGSDDGFTFPPGSGIVNAPAINHEVLLGDSVTATTSTVSSGSSPLTGAFQLTINQENTGLIPYNIDALALESTINDLQSVGQVTVKSGLQTNILIPGITASVVIDGSIASLVGDLREHIAPGDSFRIGGSPQESDGAQGVGSASVTPKSPVLSNVQLDNRHHLHVGEQVRISADDFVIVKNGIEVQQLTVHRASGIADGDAYQLRVTINGVEEVTSCLSFDASATDLKSSLNSLTILGDNGGVFVTRTDDTSGFVGNAHFYKVYFNGDHILGDIDEMVPEHCSVDLPVGMDSTNSHFHVRTLVQGGKTEHQRISLSSDAGTTNDTPAFRLSISDADANSWTSPCFLWGVESLDISSIIDGSFSSTTLAVGAGGVSDLGNDEYRIYTTTFVEGVVATGDLIGTAGSQCIGTVLSIDRDGKSFVIASTSGCTLFQGDELQVASDSTIIESFTNNGRSITEMTVLSVFSDASVESDDVLYRINVDFEGLSRSTPCLRHDATAVEVQQAIGSLFDYNKDGFLDVYDEDHIQVSRRGDGSLSSGYGYVYEFLSKGSSSTIGASGVLGTSAPTFSVTDVGSAGGCFDSGVDHLLITNTASTINGSNLVVLGLDATGAVHAGALIRVSSSLDVSKMYTVDHTSEDGTMLVLAEDFGGFTISGTASLYLIKGGTPQFNVEVMREGQDEYVYDLFFTGSHWTNAPEIQVNTFGDGACGASYADIADGMNRNIGVKTLLDGGGMIGANMVRYVLDRAAKRDQFGTHDLFVVPPIFTVHEDTSEVQRIIVMDDNNDAIWGSGQPSYILSFDGESTDCLAYDASDAKIESALNSLTTLCPGFDSCVTVTRRTDSVQAPNGHVYTVYFDSSSVARKDINDPGVNGLVADASHSDCNAFDASGGERIVINTLVQGTVSSDYTNNQVPFGKSSRWIGESRSDLPLYRVSGNYWYIRFGQSLGSVDSMSLTPVTLSSNAELSVESIFFNGVNPDHVVVSDLTTGIPYFFRAYSRNTLASSVSSGVVSAMPSERPARITRVFSGHALRENEIQSLVIAASHQKELQTIRTSAIPIPEVQEISLEGTEDSDMDSYLFSLRHPEIQVVKWSAGSPVTDGSFFLKLLYVDRTASDIAGTLVYKELKTPCISFGATAKDVKKALETDAIENGLGLDSVSVTRSGNRSYSSNYGYAYKIHFVGNNVRGNVIQMTSETALTGLDSIGGTSCSAFVSVTNDASIDIWTENESQALGTDTPRAEVVVDANTPIFDGEFQLSLTHLGHHHTTECIPWDATSEQIESALQNLDNVDSVHVVTTGHGLLSDSGEQLLVRDYAFQQTDEDTFQVSSPSDGLLSDTLSVADVIQFSGQSDASTFYQVVSLVDNALVIDKPFDGDSTSMHYVTRFFGFRHAIYFDGNAMHTDGDGSTGFMPRQGSNFMVVESSGCQPLRAFHNNVLKETADIPDAIVNIRVISAYDGGHNLPGSPTTTSSLQISRGLTSSLPMTIREAHTTQSIETLDNGLTFTITYGSDDGNVPTVVCNHVASLVGCNAKTVMDGNVISGSFYLDSSDPIPHDATAEAMKLAIEAISGVGNVEVARSGSDGQGGYTWDVTFDKHGDVPILHSSNSLSGKGATVSVTETVKGNELGGSFALTFGSETIDPLPIDVDSETLQLALEGLGGVGQVDVNTNDQLDSEFGRSYTVTFMSPYLGDVQMLVPHSLQTTGVGNVISVSEVVKGSLASREALHVSFEMPKSCSTSDVGLAVCGDPITEVMVEISPNAAFTGSPLSYRHVPDYATQTIRTYFTGDELPNQLSGYFNIAYDEVVSEPLNAHASDNDVRVALESLPGINTAKVKRNLASQDIDGVCIDIAVGSPLVQCDPFCSPCNFAAKGIKANRLIMVGQTWFRVSSSYDNAQESFYIASEYDSNVSQQYIGEVTDRLQVWTGGYEWDVSLLSVVGEPKPISTPVHHLLPTEAAIDISAKDCDRCIYADSLLPGKQYYIRTRARNSRGWSDYSDVISETPRGIPTAPTNVRVNAVSGTCLEVSFYPPIYGDPLASYVVQWDYSDVFALAQDESASCTSLRYGSCAFPPSSASPPYKHEFCGLSETELYYVRVSATNSVQVQSIFPSDNPKDNTKWSPTIDKMPVDQVPNPPSQLNALVLGLNGVQLLFHWPDRDGGKEVSEFIVFYDTSSDFTSTYTMSVASTLPEALPSSGGRFVFDFVPTTPQLDPGVEYFIKLAAVNDIGIGEVSALVSVTPSGPSEAPSAGTLTTLELSESPITEVTVTWTPPSFTGGYPVAGYVVEWWSIEKQPEVQLVRLQYTSVLSETTFTLGYSPSPTVKKVTSNLPWNAPADLVRRELINLGWDESEESALLSDVEVTRTTLAKGYLWSITFGNNSDRTMNDGDQVSLVGHIMENGDAGSPSITVSTLRDGQRAGGLNEVQYLQVVGTGTLSGHYRIKFSGSEWTSYIPIHASASYIENALEQLSTVGEVDVIQNDAVDQILEGTEGNLVHHYEVHFSSNPGNLEAMVIDYNNVDSSNNDVQVLVYDGNNALDSFNTKESGATPGELPVLYGNSGVTDSTTNEFQITGLDTGREYYVAISTKSALHGLSSRLIPLPSSITPPLQSPGIPKDVSLSVNTGYSDSIIVNFNPPDSTGGSDVLFYRVELDPTASFDNPIVQDFECPASNKRTEWEVETSVDGNGVIDGGSFRLELEVDGFTAATSTIPYDAVALASNETGMFEELIPTFSTLDNSNALLTIPPTDIEQVLFPGDRLQFSGQNVESQYFEVVSVSGTSAILSDVFTGDDGVQISTTRCYGGRGNSLSSRIHCQFDEDLCPLDSEAKSGSLQNKLEDLSLAIHRGVFVDRDGPNIDNGFIWRVTFLDDAYPLGSDYSLRIYDNALTTFGNLGTPQVSVRLLNSGNTYTSCSGSLVVPSYGGLVKGLEYYGRVSARNSEGYSLPMQALAPLAPKVVPGAPTGVVVDVLSATVLRVIFGSPSDNGGDSITEYLIEWSPDSAFVNNVQASTLDFISAGSPFFKNIEGLTTGVYYFVRVKAKNSQGYGISQMSTPSSLNPHQKPSPPTNVKLGITSDTMLTIGWDPPLFDGGDAISKYRVEWDTRPEFMSSSYPPNKGYVDVDASARSYTVELLASSKNYYMRVYAMNTAGSGTPQTSNPIDSSPALQVPGIPHSLQASAGSIKGRIEVSWQRPRVPRHGIPCSSEGSTIKDCPTPYGGVLPSSDGGDAILEYELEYNERSDFLGSDGGRMTYVGFLAMIDNLYSGRVYFVRVLARNSIGSGQYSAVDAAIAP
eukprot:scaffold1976_cov187-Alexandrium_tamarense.AAC.23